MAAAMSSAAAKAAAHAAMTKAAAHSAMGETARRVAARRKAPAAGMHPR